MKVGPKLILCIDTALATGLEGLMRLILPALGHGLVSHFSCVASQDSCFYIIDLLGCHLLPSAEKAVSNSFPILSDSVQLAISANNATDLFAVLAKRNQTISLFIVSP